MELQSPAEKAPKFPGDAQESNVPALFTKLHRRSGERAGLYLAETKNRFVVSDGQWEVLAVWAVVITFAVIVLFMILGKATSEVALIIVAGCLTPCLLVEVLFMRRLTTTLDRRRRRMIQDTTRWCCVTRRNEFDLDDVVKLAKKGLGRQAIIEAHLSSGETVPLTYASIFKSQDDLKTNGPNRMNNFLLRVRGLAKRQVPPRYLLARSDFESCGAGILSLKTGEVVRVVSAEGENGWWRGKLSNGEEGWFPASWTNEMAPSEIAASNNNSSSSGGS